MTTRSSPWPAGTPCWVDMSIADVAGAQRFYGSVLGWEFHDTGERLGHYMLCRSGGRNVAAFYRPMPGSDGLPWTVYLATDDLDATVEAVVAHGGTVVTEQMHIPGIGSMAIATDPSGGLFGMWQQTGMIGFGVVDEDGAVARTEARLTVPEAGAAFYAAVFGPVELTVVAADPSHWLTYFTVPDLDAAAGRVAAGGGGEVTPATPTAGGREGVYSDPSGVLFGLHEPA